MTGPRVLQLVRAIDFASLGVRRVFGFDVSTAYRRILAVTADAAPAGHPRPRRRPPADINPLVIEL